MKHPLGLALAVALAASATLPAVAKDAPKTMTAPAAYTGIFASDSPLPLHYPQFDKIKDTDFAPAFDAGMAEELAEVRAIADNPKPATFDNTILAMEKTGRTFSRARSVFYNLVGADTNDARKAIRSEYAGKFAAHGDEIALDPKLFARIDGLYQNRASLKLDPESLRLLEHYHTDLVRSGAKLSDADKSTLRTMNAQLADLGTKFDQAVQDEVKASAVVLDDAKQLGGLGPNQVTQAADEAKARGLPGKYVLTLLNFTDQPAQSQLTDRAVRQKVHEASVARGSHGGPYDTTALVSQIMKLRANRAKLLGYPNHAAFVLEDETAKTPQAVNDMLSKLAPAAVANAKREAADLQAEIDREQKAKGQKTFQLQPWDWSFYSEKVRKAKYDFDEGELKPYLELTNVLENGVFYAANQEYGLTFKKRTDLPLYHPDITTYDVFDRDGKQLAIFIFDPYKRDSKRGGAWMNSYVSQSRLTGFQPVVANHLNIPKPPAGQPTLLTWSEATTAFHEFGHALHGMFSNVEYPYFSGTSVPRDFVEFPSQVNEMWADYPSILKHYAKHYQTGAEMPPELLAKVAAAAKFNQGFATTAYLGAAMLDQRWHQVDASQLPDAGGVMAFEAAALKADGIDYAPVPPRYRTPYFSHIMGGYSAGYYAYIWSEVLDANTQAWFEAHGGLSRANGDRFRETLLSKGGSVDAMQLFQDFAGAPPKIEPLLEKRGLVPAK